MVVPSYITDLNDINLGDTDPTDWAEMLSHKSGSSPSYDTDYFIQGVACTSQATGQSIGTAAGIAYTHGSDVVINPGDCFFLWQVLLAANNIYGFAQGGMTFWIGEADGDWYGYNTSGDDFGRNPYGGWFNAAVDPTLTGDYQEGTPDGTYQAFGSLPNLRAAVTKGSLHAADALRYGRGSLTASGGEGANYATFSGMSAANDHQDARWGLFQEQGTGYLWKGLMSFGTNQKVVDFRDSNVNIAVDVTPRTYSSFNRIEIHNASSNVEWTGVNIASIPPSGVFAPGEFEVVDDATVILTNCVFTDMNTFIYQPNSVLDTTTWRRCGQVTQGGGDFDDCIFDASIAAVSLYVSDLDNVDNCDFTSDGSNHAMELSNAHAGNSYTLTGCTYNGYAGSDGDTGNEVIFNDSGGVVTINIIGGDTPTYRDGIGATTILVINPVVLQLTVTDITTTNPISGARCLVTVSTSANFPWHAEVDITGSGTTATVAHLGHGYSTGENVMIVDAVEDYYNGAYEIIVTGVDAYTYTATETLTVSPATGTILATTALINELTDEFGVASDTRSYNNNQPVEGRVRMSTFSPYYQQSPVLDIVDKATGKSINIQMIRDE
jgi:hypothetical protein